MTPKTPPAAEQKRLLAAALASHRVSERAGGRRCPVHRRGAARQAEAAAGAAVKAVNGTLRLVVVRQADDGPVVVTHTFDRRSARGLESKDDNGLVRARRVARWRRLSFSFGAALSGRAVAERSILRD